MKQSVSYLMSEGKGDPRVYCPFCTCYSNVVVASKDAGQIVKEGMTIRMEATVGLKDKGEGTETNALHIFVCTVACPPAVPLWSGTSPQQTRQPADFG